MYYLKIRDEDGNIGNTLIYYCRNCGHEDTTLSTTNICVSDIQLRTSEKKYTHIVNEYTKFDPTLPRINTIKCPNQECSSNTAMKGGAPKTSAVGAKTTKLKIKTKKTEASLADEPVSAAPVSAALDAVASAAPVPAAPVSATLDTTLESEQTNREVIYIRYDDTNMKYVYLCVHCDTTWRTDNRI
jgi:DNA-directed RNA polymerase subunit M/transcription elongation factor TFIIS